jgi:hypothetical protein
MAAIGRHARVAAVRDGVTCAAGFDRHLRRRHRLATLRVCEHWQDVVGCLHFYYLIVKIKHMP